MGPQGPATPKVTHTWHWVSEYLFFCLILCVYVPECVSVHCMCSGTWEVRRVRATGTRVNDSCGLPCECWGPKPDPLHEQPASTPNCWTTAPAPAWVIFLLDMYSFLFGPYLYRNRIAGTYNNSNFWGNANFFQQLYHLIHSSMGSKYYSFSIALFITFFNIMSISLFLHYTKDLLRASSIQEIEAGKTGGRGQPGLHIKTLSQKK